MIHTLLRALTWHIPYLDSFSRDTLTCKLVLTRHIPYLDSFSRDTLTCRLVLTWHIPHLDSLFLYTTFLHLCRPNHVTYFSFQLFLKRHIPNYLCDTFLVHTLSWTTHSAVSYVTHTHVSLNIFRLCSDLKNSVVRGRRRQRMEGFDILFFTCGICISLKKERFKNIM